MKCFRHDIISFATAVGSGQLVRLCSPLSLASSPLPAMTSPQFETSKYSPFLSDVALYWANTFVLLVLTTAVRRRLEGIKDEVAALTEGADFWKVKSPKDWYTRRFQLNIQDLRLQYGLTQKSCFRDKDKNGKAADSIHWNNKFKNIKETRLGNIITVYTNFSDMLIRH